MRSALIRTSCCNNLKYDERRSLSGEFAACLSYRHLFEDAFHQAVSPTGGVIVNYDPEKVREEVVACFKNSPSICVERPKENTQEMPECSVHWLALPLILNNSGFIHRMCLWVLYDSGNKHLFTNSFAIGFCNGNVLFSWLYEPNF